MYLVAWETKDYGQVHRMFESWKEVEECEKTLMKCSEVWDVKICRIIKMIK